MPGSLDAALSFASKNWMTTIGLLAVGVLAYWYLAARSESDPGASNTASAFMERADRGFGGALGATSSIVVGLLAIGVTIVQELAALGIAVNDLLGGAPVLLGHFLWGIISLLQMDGILPFGPETAGWLFAIITIVAATLKFTSAGDEWGEVIERDD